MVLTDVVFQPKCHESCKFIVMLYLWVPQNVSLLGILLGFKTHPKSTERIIEQHTFDEFFDGLRLHRVLHLLGRIFGLVLAALVPSLSILPVPAVLVDQRDNQLLRFLHRFGSVEAADIHKLKHTMRYKQSTLYCFQMRLLLT